jgi:hypothetical protein
VLSKKPARTAKKKKRPSAAAAAASSTDPTFTSPVSATSMTAQSQKEDRRLRDTAGAEEEGAPPAAAAASAAVVTADVKVGSEKGKSTADPSADKETKKGEAVGYHYWHEQANQGTAPKAVPMKLTDAEAAVLLAKELEGTAGGGLSSWNKVRRHSVTPFARVIDRWPWTRFSKH